MLPVHVRQWCSSVLKLLPSSKESWALSTKIPCFSTKQSVPNTFPTAEAFKVPRTEKTRSTKSSRTHCENLASRTTPLTTSFQQNGTSPFGQRSLSVCIYTIFPSATGILTVFGSFQIRRHLRLLW